MFGGFMTIFGASDASGGKMKNKLFSNGANASTVLLRPVAVALLHQFFVIVYFYFPPKCRESIW
jgi:hypothetical protein